MFMFKLIVLQIICFLHQVLIQSTSFTIDLGSKFFLLVQFDEECVFFALKTLQVVS